MLAALVLAIAQESHPQVETDPKATTPDAEARALLEELIERSRAIKSFSAQLRVKPTSESPTTIRIDYFAPDVIRVETTDEESSASSWCRGSVLCIRSRDHARSWHARIDTAGIAAEMRPIEEALDREFPAANAWNAAPSGRILIDATFDASRNEGYLDFKCMVISDTESPFGWLPLLRDRRGKLEIDADHLLFHSEDGRVDTKIAKATGFLEEIVAQGAADRSVTVTLESLTIDGAIDPDRLELPTGEPAGDDLSETYHRFFHGSVREFERAHVYRRIGSALPAGAIDAAARPMIEKVIVALVEVEQRHPMDHLIADMKGSIDERAAEMRSMRDAGSSTVVIANWVASAREQIKQSIERAAAQFATIRIPDHLGSTEHDAALQAIELTVLTRQFDERCRVPLLAAFDKKTSQH